MMGTKKVGDFSSLLQKKLQLSKVTILKLVGLGRVKAKKIGRK
jgi:hypothetical protein